jgi:chemotaxis response regulator CheB
MRRQTRRWHTVTAEEIVRTVRILLAGMSNMLVNIVTAVLAQVPEANVAGAAATGEDLAGQIRLTNSDVVMIQTSQPDNSDAFEPLLRRFPKLRVVAIADNASHGTLHELRPHRMRLPELSAESLTSALRAGPAHKPH